MPVDPDLQTLRADALDLAELTGSPFAVEARVNRYINYALGRLHDLMANNAGGEEYIRKTTTISVTAGTAEYSLPSDFYKSVAVYWTGTDGNRLYQIDRWTPASARGFKASPANNSTVRVDYVPEAPVLSDDADKVTDVTTGGWAFACSPFWPDWLVHDVALRLINKEESSPASILRVRDELWAEIRQAVTKRDFTGHEFVADAQRHDSRAIPEAYNVRLLMYRIKAAQTVEFIEDEIEGY